VVSQNSTSVSPALKQVFLIGEGTNNAGALQQVVVPNGAARLFLGTMDGSGWYNNSGSFDVRVSGAATSVTTVVPGTSNLWLAGATNGTSAASGDSAPGESPLLVTGVALAPNNWSHVSTNKFGFTGVLSLTNVVSAGERLRWFRLGYF
jgi:hypothetical protein